LLSPSQKYLARTICGLRFRKDQQAEFEGEPVDDGPCDAADLISRYGNMCTGFIYAVDVMLVGSNDIFHINLTVCSTTEDGFVTGTVALVEPDENRRDVLRKVYPDREASYVFPSHPIRRICQIQIIQACPASWVDAQLAEEAVEVDWSTVDLTGNCDTTSDEEEEKVVPCTWAASVDNIGAEEDEDDLVPCTQIPEPKVADIGEA
jgi:hypothetical protein